MSLRDLRFASLSAATLLMLGACSSSAPKYADAPALPAPPRACGAAMPASTPVVKLKRTVAPEPGSGDLFGRTLKINRSLTRAGEWLDGADGWSSLSLRLYSENAATLSLHISELKLPQDAEVWICTGDGGQRHGPYRDAAGGELWTPAVNGDTMDLQVWVPTRLRGELDGELKDAQSTAR